MIQSPIQLPRSPLKFDAASAGSLAPKELKEHDQQPNVQKTEMVAVW
ncbi:hypothetical protein [Corynebacterium sp. HMSC078C09]|nr:hypothetical protein [Corynebacterium sp. HMSC078C09]MDK6807341.1 hypothetical protein [Corynebacterium aurimucosum]NJJ83626.1 hypothetical protein [Corynebacterium aurimucosum]